ncbi:hypothetical protein D3C84_622910 [compost metagenome]
MYGLRSLLARCGEPFTSTRTHQCRTTGVQSQRSGTECCTFTCYTTDHHGRDGFDDLTCGVGRILRDGFYRRDEPLRVRDFIALGAGLWRHFRIKRGACGFRVQTMLGKPRRDRASRGDIP